MHLVPNWRSAGRWLGRPRAKRKKTHSASPAAPKSSLQKLQTTPGLLARILAALVAIFGRK